MSIGWRVLDAEANHRVCATHPPHSSPFFPFCSRKGDADYDRLFGKRTTALGVAAKNGHTAVVALLLEAGLTAHLDSALYQACGNDNVAVIGLLLDAGAAINARLPSGQVPVGYAAHSGHADVVAALADGGADLEACTLKRKLTPLFLAAKHGHMAVVDVLLAHGANPNAPNGVLATPLYVACKFGHEEVVARLVHSNADVRLGGCGSSVVGFPFGV